MTLVLKLDTDIFRLTCFRISRLILNSEPENSPRITVSHINASRVVLLEASL